MYEGGLAVFDESQINAVQKTQDDKIINYYIHQNPIRQGQDIKIKCIEQETVSTKIGIYTLAGKKISQSMVNYTPGEVSVSGNYLTSGVYLIKIKDDHLGDICFKVVVF